MTYDMFEQISKRKEDLILLQQFLLLNRRFGMTFFYFSVLFAVN